MSAAAGTVPVARPARRLLPEEMAAWRGFLRVHAQLIRELDHELERSHGLPLGAYEVLLHLAETPERELRMAELADRAVLSRSGLTRLVDRLAAQGLLQRRRCPTDARGTFAVLTDEGLALLRRASRTHLEGVREKFLDRLSEDERRQLAACWERIRPEAIA